MPHSQDRHPLKRALGVSTMLHLLLAPLFVTSATFAVARAHVASGSGDVETTHVSYLRIERRSRAVRQPAAVADPKPSAVTIADATHVLPQHAERVKSAAAGVASSERADTARTHAPEHALASAGRVALTLATAAPENAADVAPQPTVQPVASAEAVRAVRETAPLPATAPAPSATPPAQVADSAARGMDVPPGGWGQSFDKPLVADEAALADVRSRYHAGSPATIEVDDAGHATHISLPGGLSADARAELEKLLRELRYVPAECNGLRCSGTLQILI